MPPKTKKQLEEERLKFVEEYEYDYDSSEEENKGPKSLEIEF